MTAALSQFAKSENFAEFDKLLEQYVELQAVRRLRGIVSARDFSSSRWDLRLRFYAWPTDGTAATLISGMDYSLDKVVDPDAGGAAGATGIGGKNVTFAAAVSRGVAYFVAVDTLIDLAGTTSGKRELRLCRPWLFKVHDVPAA